MNHKGEELDKPNYNSVDMSEVELQDRRHNYTYDNGTKVWVEDGVCIFNFHFLSFPSRAVGGSKLETSREVCGLRLETF